MGSMSCSEYLRAANFVRQRAAREQNPGAKEILQEIERSYRRFVEMEDWLGTSTKYNRPFAHPRLFDESGFRYRAIDGLTPP
jgi:hypothetical protein